MNYVMGEDGVIDLKKKKNTKKRARYPLKEG